jgi:hypothetical protein
MEMGVTTIDKGTAVVASGMEDNGERWRVYYALDLKI